MKECNHEWTTYTVSTGYWSYDIEQAGYCEKCGYDTHGEYMEEDNMILTGKFKVVGITKKTAAMFFKSLKVGDEFELSYNLNGSYGGAPWIKIIQGGEVVHGNNALQLQKNLDNFTLQQL